MAINYFLLIGVCTYNISLFVCVCQCMCVFACVWCVCVCLRRLEINVVVFNNCSSLYFLRQGPILNMGLTDLAELFVWQAASEIFWSLPAQHWGYRHLLLCLDFCFNMGSRVANPTPELTLVQQELCWLGIPQDL